MSNSSMAQDNGGHFSKHSLTAHTSEELTPTWALVNVNWTDLFWIEYREVFLDQGREDALVDDITGVGSPWSYSIPNESVRTIRLQTKFNSQLNV